MIHLLQAEWYKMWKCTHIYTLLAVLATVTATYAAITVYMTLHTPNTLTINQQSPLLLLPELSPVIAICLVAFTGLFVASEFDNNTIHLPIAAGHKRLYVFISKLFPVIIAMLLFISTVALVLTSILYLTLDNENTIIHCLAQNLTLWSLHLLCHLNYVAILSTFAVCNKNAGLMIITGVSIVLGMAVILAVLQAFPTLEQFAKIMPQYYIQNLNKLPDNLSQFTIHAALVNAAWCLAACLIGYQMFKNMNIK
jgi:hypothetical protein